MATGTGTINNATRELAMAMASAFTGALIPQNPTSSTSHTQDVTAAITPQTSRYFFFFFAHL